MRCLGTTPAAHDLQIKTLCSSRKWNSPDFVRSPVDILPGFDVNYSIRSVATEPTRENEWDTNRRVKLNGSSARVGNAGWLVIGC